MHSSLGQIRHSFEGAAIARPFHMIDLQNQDDAEADIMPAHGQCSMHCSTGAWQQKCTWHQRSPEGVMTGSLKASSVSCSAGKDQHQQQAATWLCEGESLELLPLDATKRAGKGARNVRLPPCHGAPATRSMQQAA